MTRSARELLKDKKRIVIKIGSSSLTHEATGDLNLHKIEHLVRVIADLKGLGKEVVLVSSGAIAAGRQALGGKKAQTVSEKQAHAAVGQARLMMVYQRMFSEYNQIPAQILMTKNTIINDISRENAVNTFDELLKMGTVPIVNENDSIATEELNFGGNDNLAAYVALVCHADILLNLSDVDGLFDSDPRKNPDACIIPRVNNIDDVISLAGGNGTERGTGGMITKLEAARLVTDAGIPMFILNGHNPDILYTLLDGGHVGTYFVAKK